MVSANYTVAIIVLVLFTILGIAGFLIWYLNTGFSRIGRRVKDDLEEGSESSRSGSR